MNVADLLDHQAITDLVNRAVAGVLAKDISLWEATWAPDASWKIDMFDQPLQGRGAIAKVFGQIIERFSYVAMSNFVTDLTVTGERATGKVWSQEFMFPVRGGMKVLGGCFHDEYVRLDGRWHFQSRRYETLHRGTVVEPQQ